MMDFDQHARLLVSAILPSLCLLYCVFQTHLLLTEKMFCSVQLYLCSLLIVIVRPAIVNNNRAPTKKDVWMLLLVAMSIKKMGPTIPPTSMKVRYRPIETPRNSGLTMSERMTVRVEDTSPAPRPSTKPMGRMSSKDRMTVYAIRQ